MKEAERIIRSHTVVGFEPLSSSLLDATEEVKSVQKSRKSQRKHRISEETEETISPHPPSDPISSKSSAFSSVGSLVVNSTNVSEEPVLAVNTVVEEIQESVLVVSTQSGR